MRNGIRRALTAVLLVFVLAEAGPWTAIALGLIALEREMTCRRILRCGS